MSEALAFDSHQFVKHLTDSGFTEEQAEALATEQVALLTSNLATKAELALVQREIEALRQETKAELALVQREIEALRQETKAAIERRQGTAERGCRGGYFRLNPVLPSVWSFPTVFVMTLAPSTRATPSDTTGATIRHERHCLRGVPVVTPAEFLDG